MNSPDLSDLQEVINVLAPLTDSEVRQLFVGFMIGGLGGIEPAKRELANMVMQCQQLKKGGGNA